MPQKPPRKCTVPGCSELVGRDGCPLHPERDRDAARKAAKASRWVYRDPRWRVLRDRVRREEPTCRRCGRNPTAEVDHVIPLEAGGRPFDRANTQGLCVGCHRAKSAEDARRVSP